MNHDYIWQAFDEWERTQRCVRGHVRIVREDIKQLVEQYQALESAARGVSDYLDHVAAEETDEIHVLAARLWTVLHSNPARDSG